MFKDQLKKFWYNIPGWHTNKKIIVFESDDWGSIRIPSKKVWEYLKKSGYDIDRTPYSKDCLESNDELNGLLEVLFAIKNKDGIPAKFTLNNIVANPDFTMIKGSGYRKYHFEPFTETYKSYPNHDKCFKLLREGISKLLIFPQLHGREHLNVARWMNSLQSNQLETIDLFKFAMFSLPAYLSKERRKCFQRAFDFDKLDDQTNSDIIVNDACKIFKELWGFKSESFIAPNFFWNDYIENELYKNGIKYLQGQRAQYLTQYNGSYKARHHYTGERNLHDQIYLIRNCFFEPSFNSQIDWVDSCMRDIYNAFICKKPAIISSHRVNYIGSIDPANRDNGLSSLTLLLKLIIKKWPDVSFMSSNEVGKIITTEFK